MSDPCSDVCAACCGMCCAACTMSADTWCTFMSCGSRGNGSSGCCGACCKGSFDKDEFADEAKSAPVAAQPPPKPEMSPRASGEGIPQAHATQ